MAPANGERLFAPQVQIRKAQGKRAPPWVKPVKATSALKACGLHAARFQRARIVSVPNPGRRSHGSLALGYPARHLRCDEPTPWFTRIGKRDAGTQVVSKHIPAGSPA